MVASGHFQDSIEDPAAADIVVLIVWSRLGTMLPERSGARIYRGMDDRTPVTGTEWEFETALAAHARAGTPDIVTYRKRVSPSVPLDDPARKAAMEAQWDNLSHFWRRHFAEGGGFKAAFNDFETLEAFEAKLESDLRALIEARIRKRGAGEAAAPPLWLKGNPYRGLAAYTAGDSSVFFGRAAATQDAVERLLGALDRGQAFLAVLGASGSGKSSLVRAGVMPALAAPGVASGVGLWRQAVMRPGGHGGDVVAGLAAALIEPNALPELLSPGQGVSELAAFLRDGSPPGFLIGGAMNRIKAAAGAEMLAHERPMLMLAVDQFEELFTDTAIQPEERARFVACLDQLTQSGHVAAVVTMRSDFWHRASEMPGLVGLVERGARLDLLAPSPAEIGEMIRRPAEAAGVGFERDARSELTLDRMLADEAAAQAGSLPLLSFLLELLFEDDVVKGGGRQMTVARAEALGGLKGAIATRASAVLKAQPDEVAGALPKLLRQLVQVRQGDVPTSRLAPLSVFPDGTPIRALTDVLVSDQVRLLVAEGDGGAPRLRIAHEALLTHWDVAADWARQNRRDLETRARLEDAAALWADAEPGDRKARLLQGLQLAEAIDLKRRWGGDVAHLDAFIDASESAARRKSRRNWAIAASVMAVLAGLSGVAVLFALEAQQQSAVAQASAAEAERNRAEADAKAVEAENAKRLADTRANEASAEKVRAEQEEVRGLAASAFYRAASEPYETLPIALQAIRLSLDRHGKVDELIGAQIAGAIAKAAAAIPDAALRSDIVYSALSPSGDRVIAVAEGRRTLIIARTSGTAAEKTVSFDADIRAALMTSDGTRTLVALSDGQLLATAQDGTPAQMATLPAPPTALAVLPFGSEILAGLENGVVVRLDRDLQPQADIRVAATAIALANASPDGTRVYLADMAGAVHVLPVAGVKAQLLAPGNAPPVAMTVSRDGRYLAVSRTGRGTTILSARDGQFVMSLERDGGLDDAALAFAPDSLSLLLVNAAGAARVLHLPSRQIGERGTLLTPPATGWRADADGAWTLPAAAAIGAVDVKGRGQILGLDWGARALQACTLSAGTGAAGYSSASEIARDTCRQLTYTLGRQPWLQGFAALADPAQPAAPWRRLIRENQRAPGGWTLAHAAARAGRTDVLEMIKAIQPDALATPDASGETPIFAAARAGAAGALEFLIASGAAADAANAAGETPLLAAAESGRSAAVEILLKAGARVSVPASNGETPLSRARSFGFDAVAALLSAAGAEDGERTVYRAPPDTNFVVPAEARAETREALEMLKREGHAATARAADLYETAFAAGDPFAAYLLSRAYRFGEGRDQNLAKAFELVIASVAGGSPYGINELGNYYNNGIHVLPDAAKATEHYARAAALGNERAIFNLADDERDDAKARAMFAEAHDIGNAGAGVALARMLMSGRGGAPEPAEAIRILEGLAPDYNDAAYVLGDILENGSTPGGIAADAARAITLFEQAAKMGHAAAMYRVGRAEETGMGRAAASVAVAYDWYRRAAAAGNGPAKIALGRLLSDGDPAVPDSAAEALVWLIAADGMEARSRASTLAYRQPGLTAAVDQIEAIVPFPEDGERKLVRYDASGLPTRIETPGRVSLLTYVPGIRKLASVTEIEPWSEADPLRSDFTYDAAGNLVRAARSDGRWVELTYEPGSALIVAMTNDRGQTLRFTYDRTIEKPIRIEIEGVGRLDVSYTADGEIEKIDSPEGHEVSLAITQAFQDLLTLVKPAGVSI